MTRMFGKEVWGLEIKKRTLSVKRKSLWEIPASSRLWMEGVDQTRTTSSSRTKVNRMGREGFPVLCPMDIFTCEFAI